MLKMYDIMEEILDCNNISEKEYHTISNILTYKVDDERYFKIVKKFLQSNQSPVYIPEVALFLKEKNIDMYNKYLKSIEEGFESTEECEIKDCEDVIVKQVKIKKTRKESEEKRILAKNIRRKSKSEAFMKSRAREDERSDYKKKLGVMMKKLNGQK